MTSPVHKRLTIGRIAWRFLTGHPWHGRKLTDATWFRAGREPLRVHDRPMRWSFLPRSIRMLVRVSSVVVPLAVWWAWYHAPMVLTWVSVAVLLVCAVSFALTIVDKRMSQHTDKMPARVTLKSIAKELEFTDGGSPLIGLSMGHVPVRLDLDGDAPHVALSMGTGAGKSSVLRGIIAQGLRSGWEHVTIIDPKYVSLNEFRDHPRVTICRTWPEQWDAIMEFQSMMDDRYTQLNDDDSLTFPRRVLIMEEGNSWAQEMGMYWREVYKGKGVPPVIRSIAFVLFKGRQVNCNVIGAWQRLSVGAVGSGDARDQFGTKLLARFSQQAWNSLVGTNPRPRSSRHPGRCIIVTGESQVPTQLAYWSPEEAMTYASKPVSGTDEAPHVPHVPAPRVPGQTSIDESTETHDSSPVSLVKTELPDIPVTLEEAISGGYVTGLNLNGLRTARARDGFPESIGKRGKHMLYSSGTMQEWDRARTRRAPRSVGASQ